MLKILLLKPAHLPDLQPSVIPPLGPLYLVSYLREHRPQDAVRLLDFRLGDAVQDQFLDALEQWQPDVVGISAITVEAAHAEALAAIVRQRLPEALLVQGGPHATGYARQVLDKGHVDVCVLHEGEETMAELLQAVASESPWTAVPGIAYRGAQGTLETTPARPYKQALDDFPFPAWDEIDFDAYARFKSFSLVGGGRVAPLFTSRACPYRCTYCHDMFGKKFQTRSVDNVIAEMRLLYTQYGIDRFEIIDDIFNLDKQRTTTILRAIRDLPFPVHLAFPNGIRGDIMDDAMVDLFVAAGTEFVSIAIESGSPRIQQQIRKHIRLDKVRKTIDRFVSHRVFTNCFYMLGFPGETASEMQMTVDFACAAPSHTAMFFIVTPFQGTALFTESAAPGAENAYKDINYMDGGAVNISGTHDNRALNRRIWMAYLRFVLNPRRIYRLLRDHPNRGFLPDLARLFLLRIFARVDRLNQHRDTLAQAELP